MNKVVLIRVAAVFSLFFLTVFHVGAQGPLSRRVSLQINQQRLDQVLEIISNQAGFYFSYNSRLVRKDSLVSISIQNRPVKEALQQLFGAGFEFRESGQYVIIRRAPIDVTIITRPAVKEERFYSVSGYVYDESSGIPLYNASVYEKQLLVASLTNPDGFFKLRLKTGRKDEATITVSKEFYEDTSVVIETRKDQELQLTLVPFEMPGETVIVTPDDYLVADSLVERPQAPVAVQDTQRVEKTQLGKILLSARQKAQSLNLKNFFTDRPFQVSLIPGISTHGKLGSQVVNNFSLNLLGGYTAGTNGFELGGLFNIDQKNVQYAQVGGIFNVVGGRMTGLQVAGVTNVVLDTLTGFQAAGVGNYAGGTVTGMQVSGIYNHTMDSLRGVQVAGIGNFSLGTSTGVQVSGLINISHQENRGLQIAGIFNYTRRLKGVQIGLINIADTSDGYSIGLINIILRGYHKLSLSTNELMWYNASFKTGSTKLYSILMAGMHNETDRKLYAFGYGLGSERYLVRRKWLSVNPEISSQYLYRGTWKYLNLLNRAQLNLAIHFGRHFAIYGGPAYSVLVSDQENPVNGYLFDLPQTGKKHQYSQRVSGWFGWNAGVHIF